jgi:rSAM/selenodomain-associated transferase 1
VFPTAPPPPRRLLVFARVPQLGRVKTRLAQAIGEERALLVYQAMLADVVAGIGTASADLEIECLWPPEPGIDGAALQRAFGPHPVAMQTGQTLGDRLCMAFSERFFFHRTEAIIAIGADDPSLGRPLIDRAFALLESCEWVVGPAEDGGYYLVGCRAGSFDPDVFRDVAWGTAAVLETTLTRIAATGRTVALLPERYDVDTVEDLHRYAAEERSGETARLLRELELRARL